MTDDRAIYVVLVLMMLILPLSSLLARRPSAGVVVRSLFGWAVIVAILYVAFRIARALLNWRERWENS